MPRRGIPTDNYSIAYGQFVPSLVKAVQEQEVEIGKLKLEIEQLEDMKAENATLKLLMQTQAAQLEKIIAALQGAGIAVEK